MSAINPRGTIQEINLSNNKVRIAVSFSGKLSIANFRLCTLSFAQFWAIGPVVRQPENFTHRAALFAPDVHIQMTRAARRSFYRIRNSDFAHRTAAASVPKSVQHFFRQGGVCVLPNLLLPWAASCCLTPPLLSLYTLYSYTLHTVPSFLKFTPSHLHPRLMLDSVAPSDTFQTPFILCRMKYRTKTAPPRIRNIMYWILITASCTLQSTVILWTQ